MGSSPERKGRGKEEGERGARLGVQLGRHGEGLLGAAACSWLFFVSCSISCAMGPGLGYGQSGSFEHSDSQCLESKRGWGTNHLPLWGNKSLCNMLRHRLKTLSDGANDRSNW
jgi:hypothetical protein